MDLNADMAFKSSVKDCPFKCILIVFNVQELDSNAIPWVQSQKVMLLNLVSWLVNDQFHVICWSLLYLYHAIQTWGPSLVSKS